MYITASSVCVMSMSSVCGEHVLGTRVVWWARVVCVVGASDWYYLLWLTSLVDEFSVFHGVEGG